MGEPCEIPWFCKNDILAMICVYLRALSRELSLPLCETVQSGAIVSGRPPASNAEHITAVPGVMTFKFSLSFRLPYQRVMNATRP